jgi:hypothetical protein
VNVFAETQLPLRALNSGGSVCLIRIKYELFYREPKRPTEAAVLYGQILRGWPPKRLRSGWGTCTENEGESLGELASFLVWDKLSHSGVNIPEPTFFPAEKISGVLQILL